MKRATVLDNLPVNVDHERVLREMRIPHAKTLDDLEEKPLAEAIKKAIDSSYGLIKGRGVYKTFALDGVNGQVVEGEQTGGLFSGANIVKLLTDCDYATLLACTIGDQLETEVERLQNEAHITEAYILEMVGGWMADYMADRVDERIEREIKRKGYARTMRYSPGYGDWPLAKQSEVLRLVEAERIGISLTESDIMIPRKSVSAVIGWQGAGRTTQ